MTDLARLVPVFDRASVDRATGDAWLAAELAAGAARILVDLRADVDRGSADQPEPFDPVAFRRSADRASQSYLADALAVARPADAVLSEEADDDQRRLVAERVWIIDPLDGTREFAERHPDGRWRDDVAVHLALWERHRGLTEAAIALPARHEIITTRNIRQDGVRPASPDPEVARPIRIAVSRSRPPWFVATLADRPDVEFVAMGSAGAKTAAVLDGRVDAYLHAGGQYEWDSAAPVALATAAGMIATRLDGSALVYNQPNPWTPDVCICPPALAARLRAMLSTVEAPRGQPLTP
jgi:3'(2'), 5'-bisphosphate nucleotidase